MRTTLTLEEDVAERVKAEARRSGRPFKAVVNELLRTGLHARGDTAQPRPFRVRPHEARIAAGLNFDNIGELLEQLDAVRVLQVFPAA